MYTSLILPHINYDIPLWGHQANRVYSLQKKGIRIISMSKYNAHTDPIFKKLQFLKLGVICKVQQFKFYYKLVNNVLTEYFSHIPYLHNFEIHQNYTRWINNLFIPRVSHEYTKTYTTQRNRNS